MTGKALSRAIRVSWYPRNRFFQNARPSTFQPLDYSKSSDSQFRRHLMIPQQEVRFYSSDSDAKNKKKKTKRKYVPRKAAIELTENARTFFKRLLEQTHETAGVMLNYQQASSGQPRMVFSFAFVSKDDISPTDEGVSLEVEKDGTPRSPADALNDGKPKLYINGNAFLKVLGATVDVDVEKIMPILYDREGNRMDPNA